MMNYREKLIDSVKHLSWDSGEQIAYLDSLGGNQFTVGVDELALEYGDLCLLLDQHVRSELIKKEAVEKLRELDSLLDSMSGQENANLWTEEALQKSLEWQRVRELARTCLGLL